MADAIEATGLIRIHPSSGGPVAALRGLDLRVGTGEIAAVVGPSGSGKTTLLRLLAGLDRPSAGRLRVFGHELGAADERELERHRRERVGVVEQHYRRALSPYLRAMDAIELPLWLRGVGTGERRGRAADLLERVGLGGRGQAFRHELSGGEQQRVAFAVALATRPPLLLADEPTGELDAVTAAGLLAVVRELVRSEGGTCVIVTHDPLVERFADRVIHVADGRVVAERSTGDPGPATRSMDAQGWLAPAQTPPRSSGAVATARSITGAPVDTSEPVVQLDGAGRRYGDQGDGALGLPPISLAVARGGFHVVTGPSGSGKSTLLRLVSGLDRPTEGRVTTLGRDLAQLDREQLARFRGSHIGIVDQLRDLVPFLSALENVELGLAIRGRGGPGAEAVARDALRSFGLGAHLDRLPGGLSAGERLRVALARAMAAEPELLVLDEPTAALDRGATSAVAAMLADLDSGVTVLATTHDPALIAAASDVLDLRAATSTTTGALAEEAGAPGR